MPDLKSEIGIKLTADAQKAIDEFGKLSKAERMAFRELEKLEKKLAKDTAKAAAESAKELDKLAEAFKRANPGGTGFSGKLQNVGRDFNLLKSHALGVAAAVGGAAVAIDKITAGSLRFQAVSNNLAYSIDAARSATMGLVDDLTLMEQANTAARFGVAKNSDQFAELAEIATKLGISVGKDATSSIEDLTTALARQSPMILDNLGITLKVGDANEEYAKKLGKTVSQLTQAEKALAFQEAALNAGREAIGGLSTGIDETALSIQQLKTELLNLANEGFVEVTRAVTDLKTSVGQVDKAASQSTGVWDDLKSSLAAVDNETNLLTWALLKLVGGPLSAFIAIGSGVIDVLSGIREELRGVNDLFENTLAGQFMKARMEAQRAELKATEEYYKNLADATKDAARAQYDFIYGFDPHSIGGAEFQGPLIENAGHKKKTGSRKRKKGKSELEKQLTDFKPEKGGEAYGPQIEAELFGIEGLDKVEMQRQSEAFAQARAESILAAAEVEREAKLQAIEIDREMGVDPVTLIERERQATIEWYDQRAQLASTALEREAIENEKRRDLHRSRLALMRAEKAERAKLEHEILNTTTQVSNLSVQTVQVGTDSLIKSERRRAKARATAASTEMFVIAAVETVRAAQAFASYNYPEGILHTAAAALAIAKGASLAAQGGGGAVGGGNRGRFFGSGDSFDAAGAGGTGGSAGGLQSSAGGGSGTPSGPISTEKEKSVQKSGANRTESFRRDGASRSQPVNVQVFTIGKIDEEGALKIRQAIKSSERKDGEANG